MLVDKVSKLAMVLMLFALGYGFSFLSQILGKLGLDLRSIIFENFTHCSCNIQRPEIKIILQEGCRFVISFKRLTIIVTNDYKRRDHECLLLPFYCWPCDFPLEHSSMTEWSVCRRGSLQFSLCRIKRGAKILIEGI